MPLADNFMDELERDLGLKVRLSVLATAGGQRRHVPMPANAGGSVLARELGPEVTFWLAGRFGGETVTFPSRLGREREDQADRLRAAILDAGLTDPCRSYNDIAAEFGVSERHVRRVRGELREGSPTPDLPLFAALEGRGPGQASS